jgi:ethanolamine ammonia-lyase small subunit
MWLAREAMRIKVSGVALKDESDVQEITQAVQPSLNKS